MAAVIAAHLHHDRHNPVQVVPLDESPNGIRPSPKSRRADDARALENETDGAVAEWSVQDVSRWLTRYGEAALGKAAQEARVDGAMLLELDSAAWAELGVTSALKRARLTSEVKKAAAAASKSGDDKSSASVLISKQDSKGGRTGKRHEAAMRNHFVPACGKQRTPDGGAEHTNGWALCVANANSNPAEVKQHLLRFMGMYNVIDLLVLTINMTYLTTADLNNRGPDTWCGVVIVTLMAASGVMSSLGMTNSTIFYNTASAVSDANFIAFAKMPQTIRSMRLVNDLSIWSANVTGMSILFLAYRVSVELVGETWTSYPGGPEYASRWYYACSGWILPLIVFLYNMPTALKGVLSLTHSAMYGGLFSSMPIAPLQEDPTWAHRSSSEQIAEFVCAQAIANGQPVKPAECENGCATMYAESTVAGMTGKDGDSLDAVGEGGLGLLSSIITSIVATSRFDRSAARSSTKSGPGLTRLVGD